MQFIEPDPVMRQSRLLNATVMVFESFLHPCDAVASNLKKYACFGDGCETDFGHYNIVDENHETRTASWLPPADVWSSDLPYGWEQAIDAEGRPYYINHISKTTSYEDPRAEWEEDLHPKPRILELFRDPEVGFGFVAGSERPVVVRFVTEGGPSDGRLLPGDQILAINGEDVHESPRDHVIQLVRNCKDSVKLKVCQPPLDNSALKSAILTSSKKARLKSNPPRVRFAEGVVINGSPLYPVSMPFSGGDSCTPPMPNVLKVFLENGQTKSFKYDTNTKVKDVILSLKNKLCLHEIQHFALVLEQVKSVKRNKLTLLNPEHTIAKVASRPGIHNMRCLFRVGFVPKDACDLAQQDLTAFEYLYMQCCNDVVHERYAPELKYDTALRLAALHIHQHAISNNIPYNKVTVKSIEKEFGLDKFVPVSLMESMKRKEIRKLLTHLLKLNQTITGTTYKTLTSLQAKLYYLTIISELPSYGAKCFSTGMECNVETVILVSPKLGISQIIGMRSSMPVPIADIEQLEGIRVLMHDQVSCSVTLYIPSVIQKELTFMMEDRDAEEFVLFVCGYYRLLTGHELLVELDKDIWTQECAPAYHTRHVVLPSPWNCASYESDYNSNIAKYADYSCTPQYVQVDQNVNTMKSNNNSGTIRLPSHIKYVSTDSYKNVMLTDQNGYLMNKSNNTQINNTSIDLHSVIPMEILENGSLYLETPHQEAVMKRIAEMQEVVENSEQYLSQHQRESSDSDGSHISSLDSDTTVPAPGQLKHSDSLTLLAQNHTDLNSRLYEAMQALQLTDAEESDTDSISTPSNSPSRSGPNNNRDSGLSFGLHTPDGMTIEQQNMQDWWRKMQDENERLMMPDPCFYSESDLIDLTLIPPPPPIGETKNEDREHLINHQAPPPPSFCDENASYSPSFLERKKHDELLDNVLSKSLNNNKIMSLDLDSFLATMIVPPPPPTPNAVETCELTSEELSSFIIPPPPPPVSSNGLKMSNGHATLVDGEKPKTESCSTKSSPVRRKSDATIARSDSYHEDDRLKAPVKEIPLLKQMSDPCVAKNVNQQVDPGSQNGVKTKAKTTPPKLPPRLDSLNTLPKRPPSRPAPIKEVVQNIYLKESKEHIQKITEFKGQVAKIMEDCDLAQAQGGGISINETKFQELTFEIGTETRTLVTHSKALIRSYMDTKSTDFSKNITECIKQLTILIDLCRGLVIHTASPLQTKNLISKLLDIINTFHDCLTNENIETSVVTKQAENLAGALAVLLRNLKIFS